MEYFRCSYLVTHRYQDENLNLNPPMEILWGGLIREVKVNNPMITMQELPWDQLLGSENQVNTQNTQLGNVDLLATG